MITRTDEETLLCAPLQATTLSPPPLKGSSVCLCVPPLVPHCLDYCHYEAKELHIRNSKLEGKEGALRVKFCEIWVLGLTLHDLGPWLGKSFHNLDFFFFFFGE